MTDKQCDMARHALGLTSKKTSFRNHYCIDADGDGYADWQALVAEGLAVRAKGSEMWVGDFFYLTREGAELALRPGEQLDKDARWPTRATARTVEPVGVEVGNAR